MTVAVRGRVPREGEGVYDAHVATHIRERLQALERALAGGNNVFASPTFPSFGSGLAGSSGAAGGGVPAGGGSSTTIITTVEASLIDIFAHMGA